MPKLARIQIFPFKALDPQTVDAAVILPSGAIEHDRRFAICDRQGDYIHGKRTAKVHSLRSSYEIAARRLEVHIEGTAERHEFDLDSQMPQLSHWLGEYFGMSVTIIENPAAGFPDDTESPGPTIVSTATLEAVRRWFGDLPLDEVRRRFRANLEIDGVEPFWEDQLAADEECAVRFAVGEAELMGTNPCQRCAVPTRHPTTGEVTREFAKQFAHNRQQSLPARAPRDRFDHFYRLATNTRPARGRATLVRVGDEVRIIGC